MAFFNNTEDADLNNDFPSGSCASRATGASTHSPGDWNSIEPNQAPSATKLNEPGSQKLEPAPNWNPLPVESITGAESVVFDGEGQRGGSQRNGPLQAAAMDATVPGRFLHRPARRTPAEVRRSEAQLPEHGSILSRSSPPRSFQPRASRRPVAFKTVFAQTLSGPFDPEESLRKGGRGGGAHPKIDRPLLARLRAFRTRQGAGGAQASSCASPKAVRRRRDQGLRPEAIHGLATSERSRWTSLAASPS